MEVIESCGEAPPEFPGYITSPNYPKRLPLDQNLDCSWALIAPHGQKIYLEFQELDLDLRSGTDCIKDYLNVHDGISYLYNVIENLCGDQAPENIISSGTSLFLKFHSTKMYSYRKGFKIKYSVLAPGNYL